MIRVLLLKDDDLLTGGIASLLHQVDGVSVIARNTNDIPDLFTEMDDIIPSILILKNSHVFADAPSMMKFLNKYPELQILVIDERHNVVHVYEKQEVRVTQNSDLLGLVEKKLF